MKASYIDALRSAKAGKRLNSFIRAGRPLFMAAGGLGVEIKRLGDQLV